MGARRFASLILGLLCVMAGCVSVFATSAWAGEVHVFERTFGSEGTGSGQFKTPLGVAVNDTTHDVYVADEGNNRVEELDSTGSLIGEFNGSVAPTGAFSGPTYIAVDNSGNPLDPSAGDVYVVDSGHGVIDKFSAGGSYEGHITGTPSGSFPVGEVEGGIAGVAVDPDGLLWVAQRGEIDNFSDAQPNSYLAERKTVFGTTGTGIRGGLAADSEDNLYFNDAWIVKTDSAGETLLNPFGSNEIAFGIAVDPGGQEGYVDDITTIAAYTLDGASIERFGSGHLGFSAGVAVDASDGTVYATDREADRVAVFNAIHLPTVRTGALSEQQPRSVTLNGAVNPEGLPVTSCTFEYGTTSAYGQSVPCSPTPGSGASPVAVSAHLIGLTPEASYHYRLVASNSAGSSPSPDHEFVTGPVLGGEFATNVASSSATLQATIDPNGDDTHYYFQYGTTTAYGAEVPSGAPGVDIGAIAGVKSVSVHLQSLEASTEYHYRFVAVQGGETFEEPDRVFTTQRAGGEELRLPDARAWELVSPPNKKAALIGPTSGFGYWLTQAASDGSGITYTVDEPLGEDTVGHIYEAQALSVRTKGGWHTQNVSGRGGLPPEGETTAYLFGAQEQWHLFSSDLSVGLLEPGSSAVPPQSPEATERTLYVRHNATGAFQPLESEADVPAGLKFGDDEMEYFTATPDLSHVVFGSEGALVPPAVSIEDCKGCFGTLNLYEWHSGQLELVNVLPNGTSRPGATVGNGVATKVGGSEMLARAVSTDGRWVVWKYGELANPGEAVISLYVRDMREKQTYKIGGPYARFETMSSDGSEVFYVETENEHGINGDLHVFDTETGTQTDLTSNHGAGEPSAGVQNAVLGSSQDGSYVYFVATGVLASGGVSGAYNLYMLHKEAGAWTTTHIATLTKEDEHTWGGTNEGEVGPNPHQDPYFVSSEVSPNGRFVAFMSNSPLTGYDNRDAVSGERDEEVYLYDAVSNRLVCASCNPTGARPVGVFEREANELLVDPQGMWTKMDGFGTNHWLAGSLVGWNNELNVASYDPRYVMDDGRLFFNSPDALVPQDTNGLEDVYEYEPAGVGRCVRESTTFSDVSEGCVGLISSGQSSQESAFMDASEGGDDVFFATSSRLVSEDYDNAYDVYDAHVCNSAVPCRSEPVSPPECTSGDSCKAAPSPQPTIFGATPSATFNGVGNLTSSSSGSGVAPRSLTRAQKLALALTACQRKKAKRKRAVCERQARARYRAKQSRSARATVKGQG
jgi:DNA-binding beta-propeller fold protein YncE